MRSPLISMAALAALFTSCAASPLAREVDDAIAELVACADLDGGRVGALVVDDADGRVLGAAMADRGFATASNMKLVSSAVALASLGPDYRFRTRVAVDGAIEEGRLVGNVVLIGGGDPTLGDGARGERDWQQLAAVLRDAGIDRVVGRVIGDASFQAGDVRGHGWQWDYLADDYAAPFGALCAAGNVLTVELSGAGEGVLVTLDPQLPDDAPWLRCDVTVRTDGEPGGARIRRPLGRQQAVLSGEIAPAAEVTRHRVAVHDPVVFAEAVATRALVDQGIEVEGAELAPGPRRVQIGELRSAPLGEVVAPLLTNSNNLYAEQFLRVAACERDARGRGDDAGARRNAGAVLAGLGVDTAGMVIADGSGLSRRNLVRPRQLVALLRAARAAPWFAPFHDGLPIAGETGTLRARFRDGPARGRVRAKTGFISRVVCLSGYVPRPEGPPLVFSVMLNDFTCETAAAKAACDRFVERLCRAVGWRQQ